LQERKGKKENKKATALKKQENIPNPITMIPSQW
jgi:hypothetical protein